MKALTKKTSDITPELPQGAARTGRTFPAGEFIHEGGTFARIYRDMQAKSKQNNLNPFGGSSPRRNLNTLQGKEPSFEDYEKKYPSMSNNDKAGGYRMNGKTDKTVSLMRDLIERRGLRALEGGDVDKAASMAATLAAFEEAEKLGVDLEDKVAALNRLLEREAKGELHKVQDKLACSGNICDVLDMVSYADKTAKASVLTKGLGAVKGHFAGRGGAALHGAIGGSVVGGVTGGVTSRARGGSFWRGAGKGAAAGAAIGALAGPAVDRSYDTLLKTRLSDTEGIQRAISNINRTTWRGTGSMALGGGIAGGIGAKRASYFGEHPYFDKTAAYAQDTPWYQRYRSMGITALGLGALGAGVYLGRGRLQGAALRKAAQRVAGGGLAHSPAAVYRTQLLGRGLFAGGIGTAAAGTAGLRDWDESTLTGRALGMAGRNPLLVGAATGVGAAGLMRQRDIGLLNKRSALLKRQSELHTGRELTIKRNAANDLRGEILAQQNRNYVLGNRADTIIKNTPIKNLNARQRTELTKTLEHIDSARAAAREKALKLSERHAGLVDEIGRLSAEPKIVRQALRDLPTAGRGIKRFIRSGTPAPLPGEAAIPAATLGLVGAGIHREYSRPRSWVKDFSGGGNVSIIPASGRGAGTQRAGGVSINPWLAGAGAGVAGAAGHHLISRGFGVDAPSPLATLGTGVASAVAGAGAANLYNYLGVQYPKVDRVRSRDII